MTDLIAEPELRPPTAPRASLGEARLAGAVSAGMALGVGELVTGLGGSSQSLVGSVGNAFIRQSGGDLARTAIRVFQTADKPALITGIVVLSLLIGAALGAASRRAPMGRRGRVRRLRGGRRGRRRPRSAGVGGPGHPRGHPRRGRGVGDARGAAAPGRVDPRPGPARRRGPGWPGRSAGHPHEPACVAAGVPGLDRRRRRLGGDGGAGRAGRHEGHRQRRPRRDPAAGADQPGRAPGRTGRAARARASPRSRSTV